MFKKIKAAIARRRRNAAAQDGARNARGSGSPAPAVRTTSSHGDDINSPLHPLNPVGIHSPLNQAAYASDPAPTRRCYDSHSSSDSGGYSSSDSSYSSCDSSSSSSSSSSSD